MLADSIYKHSMKTIGCYLDDLDATDDDHEDFVRGLIMKYEKEDFFCYLEGHFRSDSFMGCSSRRETPPPRGGPFRSKSQSSTPNEQS